MLVPHKAIYAFAALGVWAAGFRLATAACALPPESGRLRVTGGSSGSKVRQVSHRAELTAIQFQKRLGKPHIAAMPGCYGMPSKT
jgi:hypothetical protein